MRMTKCDAKIADFISFQSLWQQKWNGMAFDKIPVN